MKLIFTFEYLDEQRGAGTLGRREACRLGNDNYCRVRHAPGDEGETKQRSQRSRKKGDEGR